MQVSLVAPSKKFPDEHVTPTRISVAEYVGNGGAYARPQRLLPLEGQRRSARIVCDDTHGGDVIKCSVCFNGVTPKRMRSDPHR